MDAVRQKIIAKLTEKNLSMKDASLKMGHAHSYLYQFLKQGYPRELHERDRISLSELIGIPEDDLRGPSTAHPRRSHKSESSIFPGVSIDAPVHPAHASTAKVVPGADLVGARTDLPVYGTAQGAHLGALIVSEAAVDWVARPALLLRVRDGYGLIVSGDTMSPQHKEGSIALVNPHLPPRVGDSCVFRGHADDGTQLALIREYRGQTDTHWKVHQHNPPKDYTIRKADLPICHRSVGNYFP
jgi:hypothetical protein